MISFRRYISIVLIFLTVLILFQGLQLGRIYISEIQVNRHISQAGLKASDARSPENMSEMAAKPASERSGDDSYVLFVGSQDSKTARILEEWATYTERQIRHADSLTAGMRGGDPELIIISPECLEGRAYELGEVTSRGIDVLITALPDVSVIKADSGLQKLLGIESVYRDSVSLAGMHLFEGFFIGGERFYKAEEGEEELQDLDLEVPWYVVRAKTETFMRGLLGNRDQMAADVIGLDNEDMPAIIWSSHVNRGGIYAVNGDYFSSRSIALGILSAVEYERRPYYLYPVVNAQVFSMIDYPIAADENHEQMLALFGRDMTKVESDIIIPQLQTMASRYSYRASCFMAPKFDYDDDAPVKADFIRHYLGILHDTEGELGLTLRFKGSATLEEKLETDTAFYRSEGNEYVVHAAYIDGKQLSDALELLPAHPQWNVVHSFCASEDEDRPIIGFLSEDISVQQITSDALSHTFRQDMELLGLETALAYDNISLYMSDVFWAQDEEHEWQNSSRTAFEGMSTYYSPFKAFDRVTVSDSDACVRGYLCSECSSYREGNVIYVSSDEEFAAPDFILRTHNEYLKGAKGAQFVQIEDGAYLILPDENDFELELASSLEEMVFNREGSR